MTATSEVRFSADGAAKVQSYIRLTATTWIRCCTYDDAPPILTIHDGPADITITNPGQGEVTVYYGGSAPPGPFSGRHAYPGQRAGWPPPGTAAGRFPRFTVIRSAEEEPGCVPAASP